MRRPHGVIGSLAASTEQDVGSSISLVRARTLSVTLRCTFNAAATGNANLMVYYSPDGENFDTTEYGKFTVAVSAGNSRQESAYVIMPEHGFVKFAVKNNDATQTLTAIRVWYSIQSWGDAGEQVHGAVQQT